MVPLQYGPWEQQRCTSGFDAHVGSMPIGFRLSLFVDIFELFVLRRHRVYVVVNCMKLYKFHLILRFLGSLWLHRPKAVLVLQGHQCDVTRLVSLASLKPTLTSRQCSVDSGWFRGYLHLTTTTETLHCCCGPCPSIMLNYGLHNMNLYMFHRSNHEMAIRPCLLLSPSQPKVWIEDPPWGPVLYSGGGDGKVRILHFVLTNMGERERMAAKRHRNWG